MNICVYGASSDRLDKIYYTEAEKLGTLISRAGHRLIFGGGSGGLMGACALGVLNAGGRATGIAPEFFDEPGVLMKERCDFIFTDTMRVRKAKMEELADAFIALPGGIGTFEEFFETLTLRQLGQHGKSIALLNTAGYYDLFSALMYQTAQGGFMSEDVLALYKICASPEEALAYVESAENVSVGVRHLADYSK